MKIPFEGTKFTNFGVRKKYQMSIFGYGDSRNFLKSKKLILVTKLGIIDFPPPEQTLEMRGELKKLLLLKETQKTSMEH